MCACAMSELSLLGQHFGNGKIPSLKPFASALNIVMKAYIGPIPMWWDAWMEAY